MTDPVVLEFNKNPFVGVLYPYNESLDSYDPQKSNIAVWESPRLTTEYPVEGRQKGADRGICRIVNGLISIRFIDKQILDPTQVLEVSAGLYGEYANISGIIQQIAFSQQYTPLITQMYVSSGELAFPQLSSFANLAQNIFMRIVFRRAQVQELSPPAPLLPPTPLKVQITGSLLATNPK